MMSSSRGPLSSGRKPTVAANQLPSRFISLVFVCLLPHPQSHYIARGSVGMGVSPSLSELLLRGVIVFFPSHPQPAKAQLHHQRVHFHCRHYHNHHNLYTSNTSHFSSLSTTRTFPLSPHIHSFLHSHSAFALSKPIHSSKSHV